MARTRVATYRELLQRTSAIASHLRSLGVGPGQRCAILVKDPVDSAAAFFAALSVGAVGINVNELYRARQVEYVLRHSESSVLLAGRDYLETQPRPLDTTASCTVVEEIQDSTGDWTPVEMADEAPAQIVYTSGSTGQPKGVLTSHGALWAGVRIVAGYLGLRRDDRIAGVLPFSFVYGFNQLTTALATGATLVVERSTLAAEIVATLERERVSVLAAVPALWTQLLATPAFRRPLTHLRMMTCAGGRLAPAAVRELRQLHPQAQLFLMYGLTEVFRSTYLPAELVDMHPDSMGRAIPESTVYVVRDDGALASPGEVGELVHGGPTVALGYLGDPAATARVFRLNPFRGVDNPDAPARVVFSGDIVQLGEQGLLFYVGRRDRMIKTLGFRVGPDEIIDVILASGAAEDAQIVTEPDNVRGERIVACVVLRAGAAVDAVSKWCRAELPRHMQPARIVVVDRIPRNANGKHDIAALQELVVSRLADVGSDPA